MAACRQTKKSKGGQWWVYKTKLNPYDSANKLKVRLVVQLDTFAPVARNGTIRLLVAFTAKSG